MQSIFYELTRSSMSKKVALVLSSGGARGLAHIGVIESLIEDGYEITSISGSSIGAVVGAFYACGELETYKKWACELDRYDVFKYRRTWSNSIDYETLQYKWSKSF